MSYDELPYPSRAYPLSGLGRVIPIARLMGVSGKLSSAQEDDVTRGAGIRVLEVGCATGGNLLPIAEAWPGARFLGIDASRSQIEVARSLAAEADLSNVELRCGDLRDVDDTFGEFDYIIAHGVYSWVAPDVRVALLKMCGDRLAAGGVAYVSYNVFPGWHARSALRQALLSLGHRARTPREQTEDARRAMLTLHEAIAEDPRVHAAGLRREIEIALGMEDGHLAHDHLERHNHPVYFSEFVQQAQAAGLRYLTDADYASEGAGDLPRAMQDRLQALSDPTATGQVQDVIRNRAFRSSLLVRADERLAERSPLAALSGLHVASSVTSEPTSTAGELVYRGRRATTATRDEVAIGVFRKLQEAWPATVTVETILRGLSHDEQMKVSNLLLRLFESDQVELWAHRVASPLHRGAGLEVSPLTRAMARVSRVVVNRRHESVELDDLERAFIGLLDGSRNDAALAEWVAGEASAGRLRFETAPGDGASQPSSAHICADLLRRLQLSMLLCSCPLKSRDV